MAMIIILFIFLFTLIIFLANYLKSGNVLGKINNSTTTSTFSPMANNETPTPTPSQTKTSSIIETPTPTQTKTTSIIQTPTPTKTSSTTPFPTKTSSIIQAPIPTTTKIPTTTTPRPTKLMYKDWQKETCDPNSGLKTSASWNKWPYYCNDSTVEKCCPNTFNKNNYCYSANNPCTYRDPRYLTSNNPAPNLATLELGTSGWTYNGYGYYYE